MADWPFGRGEDEPAPHRGHGAGWGPGAAPEADRDLKNVVPELNDARRDLKAAIKKARRTSEDQQRHAAEILRRAATEIDALSEDDVDI